MLGLSCLCPTKGYLEARIELDEARLLALMPLLISRRFGRISPAFRLSARGCEGSGPIGRLSQRERFHWLVAPRARLFRRRVFTRGDVLIT